MLSPPIHSRCVCLRPAGRPSPSEQAFKPNKTPVDVTVTVGSHGLGLILTEDKEGTRWGVKGFRVMPDGLNNPGKVGRGFRGCPGCHGGGGGETRVFVAPFCWGRVC